MSSSLSTPPALSQRLSLLCIASTLTPHRGRYSLECYLDSLRLTGKSTDYRILYSSVHRIFMLPKGDEMFCQVVLGLDPPIRQGATRYPFLVMQFPKEEETEVQLELTE